MLKLLKENVIVSMSFFVTFSGMIYLTNGDLFISCVVAIIAAGYICIHLFLDGRKTYSYFPNTLFFIFLAVGIGMNNITEGLTMSIVINLLNVFMASVVSGLSTREAERDCPDVPYWKLYVSAFPLLVLFIGWPIYFWSRRTKTSR